MIAHPKNLAKSIASNATNEALKYTVLTGIMTAVALPVGLLQICNLIDATWTLAIERADEAGKELAVSLLESRTAGHRPVSLVGYSFGARVIYSCLIELDRHQKIWEERKDTNKLGRHSTSDGPDQNILAQDIENEDGEIIDIRNYNPAQYYREPASIVEDVILMGW